MTLRVLPQRPAKPPPPRPANIVAQKITGRDYVSHSQLSTMRMCPKKFEFLYVRNAEPDYQASSLLFGGAIHEALECHFRARLEGLSVTPQALLGVYHDAWRRDREKNGAKIPVRFNTGEDQEKLDILAGRVIDAFLNSPAATPPGTIIGVEEQLRVMMHADVPDVLARVDLVIRGDNALHVIDFKTSRSKWTPAKAVESAEQLLVYGVTVDSMSRDFDLPVKLHYAVITKAKTPIVQMIDVPVDAARVEAMKDGVNQVWQAIVGGNFYPSPSPQACCICPFKSRCPVFAGR